MPYTSLKRRRACVAASMRRARIYDRAVAASHPKAIEAERLRDLGRNPMRPATELHDRIKAMPSQEDRNARKAEYLAVLARCQAIDAAAARADYERLKAEVIAEAEIFS